MSGLFKNVLLWSIVARVLTILGSFVLFPFMVHYLSKEELTLYYLFASFAMLTSLIDFGFNPTISRGFSYAYSGALSLQPMGVPEKSHDLKVNWVLVQDLYVTAKKVYFYLGIGSLVIFYLICAPYIVWVLKNSHISVMYGLTCWVIFAFASVVNLYYLYLVTLLQGMGNINLANKAIIVSKIIAIIIAVSLLTMGYGLISLSISILCAGVAERFLVYKYTFIGENEFLRKIKNTLEFSVAYYIKLLMPNAVRLGFIAIGTYFIMRASTIIATMFLGLSDSASYIFTLQVIGILSSITNSVISAYMPQLNRLAFENKEKQIEMFAFVNVLTIVLFIVVGMCVLWLGPVILVFLGSKVTLLLTPEFLLLLFIYLLDIQHGNFAALITTGNNIPFLKSAVFSGIGVVFISYCSMKFGHLGVLGLILAQGIVQACFNNWYWIYYICKRYKVSYIKLIELGVVYFVKKCRNVV